MRLSPRDPLAYLFKSGLAFAHLAAGRYQEAIKWVDEALFERPRLVFAMRVKVVACAHLGRIDEGLENLRRLLELQPGLTVANFIAYAATVVSPELTALYADGFRKVGLPEE
jgi:tetratricopeptide (TPR) repeat protein